MKRKPMPVEEYRAMVAEQAKPRKYRNRPIVVDGVRWDSEGEYARWRVLQLLERAGLVGNLKRQVPFVLDLGTDKARRLEVDFTYTDYEQGKLVAEDFKGHMPPMARLKLQAFAAQYPDYELRISRADGCVEVWE